MRIRAGELVGFHSCICGGNSSFYLLSFPFLLDETPHRKRIFILYQFVETQIGGWKVFIRVFVAKKIFLAHEVRARVGRKNFSQIEIIY